MVKRCSQTKPGWYCTRDAEHSGPCCPAPTWWMAMWMWKWWYPGRGDYSFGCPGEWMLLTFVLLAVSGLVGVVWVVRYLG